MISLDDRQVHHLLRVLRMKASDPVSYTDGDGTLGHGRLVGEGLERGPERYTDPEESPLSLAVASPEERERQRFVVEKLAELGVHRLTWLATRYGEGRPPPIERARAWAISALEQSGGTRLLDVNDRPLAPSSVAGFIADRDGEELPPLSGPVTLLVGPAGGWAPDELEGRHKLRLVGGVLRVETAAVVGAALLLDRLRRARTSHFE